MCQLAASGIKKFENCPLPVLPKPVADSKLIREEDVWVGFHATSQNADKVENWVIDKKKLSQLKELAGHHNIKLVPTKEEVELYENKLVCLALLSRDVSGTEEDKSDYMWIDSDSDHYRHYRIKEVIDLRGIISDYNKTRTNYPFFMSGPSGYCCFKFKDGKKNTKYSSFDAREAAALFLELRKFHNTAITRPKRKYKSKA
jgi:hypothetical protein